MTIKNGDMPAMPLADSSIDTRESWDDATAGGRLIPVTGFTKREMIAMHICSAITGSIHDEACYLRIKSMSDRCGVKVSEWIAREAAKQADALLAELERTK